MTPAYDTELTLEQYELLASLFPADSRTGRPRSVSLMAVMQGILYVLATSCAWRLLPHDYPPSSTVYYYFRKWRNDGSWKRIHDHLVQWVRVDQDRESSPSAASLDSQSVPTAVMIHESVGYDAGKKIKGRKRFTLVDTLGLLISVKVLAASVPEREGAKQLLNQLHQERSRVPRLWLVALVSSVERRLRTLARIFGSVYSHRHDSPDAAKAHLKSGCTERLSISKHPLRCEASRFQANPIFGEL